MTRHSSTRALLRGEHRPYAQPSRRWRLWLLCLALLASVALASLPTWQAQRELSRQAAHNDSLQASNRDLSTRLEEAESRLRISQAAEQQLSRRNAELSAQIEQLTTELAFFRQHQAKP